MNILRRTVIAASGLIALATVSCDHKPDTPPEPTDPARTVLVYMVAANNLGRPAYIDGQRVRAADSLDLDEMASAAAALGNNRLVVFHATDMVSELIELRGGKFVKLKSYPHTPATDAARMAEVIADVKTVAPARSYGMVFWSHADGWLENGTVEPTPVKPMSFGNHAGKRMNVTTLRSVLEGAGMDYLYFDCCLMGSVEVAYELRRCARYIVASPAEILRNGMPYDLNLPLLADGSRGALIQSIHNTYRYYADQPLPDNRTATLTVIDTEQIDRLADATRAVYTATPLPHPVSPVTNYYGTDRVEQGNYLDFGEYVEGLIAAHSLPASAADEYAAAMAATVIATEATPKLWDTYTMYHVSGLSTRVFKRQQDVSAGGYNRLQWTQDVVTPRFNPQTLNP